MAEEEEQDVVESPSIHDLMKKLPEQVQDFIYSDVMEKIILEIGKKNGLHVDQVGALESEIIAAMAGLTKTEDLQKNIEESLSIDSAKSSTITAEVNEQIFLKVRELMKAPPTEAKKEPLATQVPLTVPNPPTLKIAVPEPKPMPVSTPMAAIPPTLTPAPAPAPKPATAPDLLAADAMLTEKKTAPPAPIPTTAPASQSTNPTPKVEPPKPQNYKTDPYREPVE
jgi:hypothetical protein